MEKKGPVGTVPALGRIALKRVAVLKGAAPPTPAAPPVIRRRALIAERDKAVRAAVVGLLPGERFEILSFEDADPAYDEFGSNGADLIILGRDLPGTAGTVLCQMIRRSKKGAAVAILLMAGAYRDRYLGAGDCNAFGADGFLPLPSTPELFHARVEEALSKREPVEKLNLLPPELAAQIDDLYGRLNSINYYELLELNPEDDRRAAQRRFHQLSRTLHPDRHARLQETAPHVFEKVNAVFKRISEAYQVITDPTRRRRYNVGLRKRGAIRLETDAKYDRTEREVAACHTEEARAHVIESLELRSLGDLEGAAECMEEAALLEPRNEELARVLASLKKLLAIIER